VIKFVNFVNF